MHNILGFTGFLASVIGLALAIMFIIRFDAYTKRERAAGWMIMIVLFSYVQFTIFWNLIHYDV